MKLTTTKRLERLNERYANGDISRRSFLTLTAAAAAATGLSTPWMGRALAAVSEVGGHQLLGGDPPVGHRRLLLAGRGVGANGLRLRRAGERQGHGPGREFPHHADTPRRAEPPGCVRARAAARRQP